MKNMLKKLFTGKKLLFALLLLGVLGAGWWLLGRSSGEQAADTPGWRYQLVERSSISSTMDGVGVLQPVNSYTVKALVTGEVLSAPFKEGDMIAAGQLLYQIDAGRAQNSYTLAQLNLQEAEAAAAKLEVCAPVSGQIVKIFCEPGDTVNSGDQLVYLRDREQLRLEAPFSREEAEELEIGQAAEVIIEKSGERFPGRISEIASVEQVSAGGVLTHRVTIELANPGTLLEGDWAAAEAGGFVSVRSGLLEYGQSEQVMAKTAGEVAAIMAAEGDYVQAGEPLVRLESDSLTNELERARIELANARTALADYQITSPIAGRVIEKKFEQGDTIDSNNSASEMAVIYDMSRLEFVMNVDENDIGLLRVGQPVQVTADALGGQEFAGTVSKISIKGNSSNGVTAYPITVTLEDFGGLLPGMNINASVVLEQAEDVLVVPMNAVSRGNMLLVANGDGEGEKGEPSDLPGYSWRSVELGLNDDYYVEVISGVQEGEKIAVPVN